MRTTMKHNITFTRDIAPMMKGSAALSMASSVLSLRCPWRDELEASARKLNATLGEVTLANLSYEILGGGCISGAVPLEGGYGMFRLLEWGIPEEVLKAMYWEQIGPDRHSRSIPGYVGVLTGHGPGYAMAMNMSPNAFTEGLNIMGLPQTWNIRSAMESCDCYERAVEFLLRAPAARNAWTIVIGEKAAAVVLNEGSKNKVIETAEWPKPLFIGNSYGGIPADKEKAILGFFQENKPEDKQVVRPGEVGSYVGTSSLGTDMTVLTKI